MTEALPERIQKVAELAARADTDHELRVLADAILYLAAQGVRQKENNRAAFEQIEELDRRHGSGDSSSEAASNGQSAEGSYFHNS